VVKVRERSRRLAIQSGLDMLEILPSFVGPARVCRPWETTLASGRRILRFLVDGRKAVLGRGRKLRLTYNACQPTDLIPSRISTVKLSNNFSTTTRIRPW
jgi:hypothetical protein